MSNRWSAAAMASQLNVGDTIIIRPISALYRGSYKSSVVALASDRMSVSVPTEHGKVVLIPVGTAVGVEGMGSEHRILFETRVIDRQGGPDRCLVLERPLDPQPRQAIPLSTQARVIAVTSGKGGVGKSTFIVNAGVALSSMGMRVCIVDADLGTANVDVLLNLSSPHNIGDVASGERGIFDVIVEGPHELVILPGGSGLQELTTLSEPQFDLLLEEFRKLEEYVDVILIDTSSGLSKAVTNFLMAATDTVLVTTPEPHAITDAYALLKVLSMGGGKDLAVELVVNMVQSPAEARDVREKMTFAAEKFLGMTLKGLGHIAADPNIGRAIRSQMDIITAFPKSPAARDIRQVAAALLQGPKSTPAEKDGEPSFLRRLRQAWQGWMG